jgi:hypothetical protein
LWNNIAIARVSVKRPITTLRMMLRTSHTRVLTSLEYAVVGSTTPHGRSAVAAVTRWYSFRRARRNTCSPCAVVTATREKKRKQPFQGLANPLHAPAAAATEAAPVDPELEARKKARAERFGLTKA